MEKGKRRIGWQLERVDGWGRAVREDGHRYLCMSTGRGAVEGRHG